MGKVACAVVSTRTQNTVRNMAWGFVCRAVALLGPFIIRMLLIQRLGADYLGLSTFYTSLLQILNIAELGFSTAVSYGMYGPIAAQDEETVARHLSYLKRVYRIIGVVILAFGVLLLPLLGFLISGPIPSDINVVLAFLIFLSNTAVGYLLFAHKQTLLVAHQRKDIVDKVSTAALLGQFLLQAALLTFAPNFYTYAFVFPLFTVVSNLALARLADRLYPMFSDVCIQGLHLTAEERVVMRKQIVGLVLQKACMLTRDPFAAVVVSAFLGLGAVARFGNYFVVISGVLSILRVFGSSMTAAVGNSIALETPEKNFNDLRLFMFMYALVSIVCAAILLTLLQPFMELWVGQDMLLSFGFACNMVLNFYLRTMGDMRTVYVDATGVWWQLRRRAVAETLANLILCVLFVYLWGIQGALVALCVSIFIFNFIYGSHLIFKFYFGMEYVRDYYIDHAVYALVALAVCALAYVLTSFIPAATPIMLLMRGLVAALIASAVCVLVFFRTKIFSKALNFMCAVKRKA